VTKVVVDRSIEPQHSQIVIAVVDGEYTIKRLYRKNSGVELRSKTPPSSPSASKPKVNEIWGVVVGVSCVGTFADAACHAPLDAGRPPLFALVDVNLLCRCRQHFQAQLCPCSGGGAVKQ
jgi:hypothetical protein